MRIDLSTVLPCSPSEVVRHLKSPRLFLYVAAPLLRVVPQEPPSFPEEWAEGTYRVSVCLLGFLPLGSQALVVSFPALAGGFSIRDNGCSPILRTWDHVITVEAAEGGTLYRDRVTLQAGLLTPLVWAFMQVFFRHRQRRWRRLVAAGFDFEAP